MLLLTLFIILGVILGGIGGRQVNKALADKSSVKTYGLPVAKVNEYSWASKKVLAMYESLPEANRPRANVPHILTALDTKYGINEVNRHHTDRYGHAHSMDSCSDDPWQEKRKCKMPEYKELWNSMKEVKNQLAAQEKAIQLAGVASGLDEIKELTEALRQEREIIKDTTKELTRGSL